MRRRHCTALPLVLVSVVGTTATVGATTTYHRFTGRYYSMPLAPGWTARDNVNGVDAVSRRRDMAVSFAQSTTTTLTKFSTLESTALGQSGFRFTNVHVLRGSKPITVTSGVRQQNLLFTATASNGARWEGQLDAGVIDEKGAYGVYAYLATARASRWNANRATLNYMMIRIDVRH